MKKILSLVLLLVTTWTQTGYADEVSDRALLQRLQQGGNVIFLRHAATDPSQKDLSNDHLEDCSTQRNLTPQGRKQSQAIGIAFRELKIPAGLILSSPYCRVKDTAQLAFGHAHLTDELKSFENMPPFEQASRIRELRTLLATPPSPTNTNTILVSHKFLFRQAAGIDIEEGEAAIFHPAGGDQFELIGRVTADHWAVIQALTD